MRRWLYRIFLALAVLILVTIVAVQAVLWTNLPRQIVIGAVEKQLGLRVTAESLSTGWFGHTTLRNVTLSLPLATEAFLSVPELRVSHSWLPVLAVTQSMTVKSIELDRPTLVVNQDAAGRWNVQDIAELLGRIGGSQSAQTQQQADQSAALVLPGVTIAGASIVVTDNRHRMATVGPLDLDGRPEGPLVWRYDMAIAAHVALTGKLAPGGDWKHEVTFKLDDVGPWISPWVKNWPDPAKFAGTWLGSVVDGHVAGRLLLDPIQTQVAVFRAGGAVEIKNESGATAVYPRNLAINTDNALVPGVKLTAGSMLLDGLQLHARKLRLSVGGGEAQLDGSYAFADGAASLTAAWDQIAIPSAFSQSGDLTLNITQPWPNQRVQATIHSHGIGGPDRWDTALDIEGVGPGPASLDWTVHSQKLDMATGSHQINVPELFANINTKLTTTDGKRGLTLAIRTVRMANGQPIAASGAGDSTTKSWWLSIDGRGWPIPTKPDQTLDIDINAWGNPNLVRLEQLYLRSGHLVFTGGGDYVFALPKPVSAQVYLFQKPPSSAAVGDVPSLFGGELDADMKLNGTVFPRNLSVTGKVYGKGLVVENRKLGDLAVDVVGDVTTDAITVRSREMNLLGGHWDMVGWWPTNEQSFKLDVSVPDLPLSQATNSQSIQGSLKGQWQFIIYAPTLPGLVGDGQMTLRDVKILGGGESPAAVRFSADMIDIPRITLADGALKLDRIRASEADDDGRNLTADGQVWTNIAAPEQLRLNIKTGADGWVLRPMGPALKLRVAGGSDHLEIDLDRQSARGHVDFSARADWKQPDVVVASGALDLDGRVVQLSGLDAGLLGGSATGAATIDLDHPLGATAVLNWHGLLADRLAELFPVVKGLSGAFGGQLAAAPSSDPRALEPLEIGMDIQPEGGNFRNVQFAGAHLSAFVGSERVVLDSRPDHITKFNIAGGEVDVWGRLTHHIHNVAQLLAQVDFRNLDINQIVHAVAPQSLPRVGQLSGSISIVTQPQRLQDASGAGQIDIANSDLADVGTIAFLYNAMNLGRDMHGPTGNGQVRFRLEQDKLNVTSARYFNKGTELRATGSVLDFWETPNSLLDFNAVGSARPLRDLKLPIIRDVDAIFSVLQNNVVSVEVDGPLTHPDRRKIAFKDLGDAMKRFLLGDVSDETGATAH